MIKINLLPKTLRKRVEPGWWRLIAVVFPLITVGVIGILQYGISSTISGLTEDRDQLQIEVQALQRYVRDQRALQAQQNELNGIIAIDNALRKDAVKWSSEVAGFVERIPRNNQGRPIVSLNSMNLRRVDPAAAQQLASHGAYDGKLVNGELALNGEAPSLNDISRFVQSFERNSSFGVQFNQAQMQVGKNSYAFSATVGFVAPAATPGAGNAQ